MKICMTRSKEGKAKEVPFGNREILTDVTYVTPRMDIT